MNVSFAFGLQCVVFSPHMVSSHSPQSHKTDLNHTTKREMKAAAKRGKRGKNKSFQFWISSHCHILLQGRKGLSKHSIPIQFHIKTWNKNRLKISSMGTGTEGSKSSVDTPTKLLKVLRNRTQNKMSVRDFNGQSKPSLYLWIKHEPCMQIDGLSAATEGLLSRGGGALAHWTASHCSAVEYALLSRIPGKPLH